MSIPYGSIKSMGYQPVSHTIVLSTVECAYCKGTRLREEKYCEGCGASLIEVYLSAYQSVITTNRELSREELLALAQEQVKRYTGIRNAFAPPIVRGDLDEHR